MKEETVDKLWNDYLEFTENYSDELTVQEMAYQLLKMTSKMIHDCSPNAWEANHLIYHALLDGQEWSNSEKSPS